MALEEPITMKSEIEKEMELLTFAKLFVLAVLAGLLLIPLVMP